MRKNKVIDLSTQPAAIYHVGVDLPALRRASINALDAVEQTSGTCPWPLRRPGLTIRSRTAGDGTFIVRLTDTQRCVHRFRGTYFDLHPWLRRLVRDTAAAA